MNKYSKLYLSEISKSHKTAYGYDYVGPENSLGLFTKTYGLKPSEQEVEKFKSEMLQVYPKLKTLKLHYNKYDSSNSVDLLKEKNLKNIVNKLRKIAPNDRENFKSDEDWLEVPFFNMEYQPTDKETLQYLKQLIKENSQ